MLEQLTNEEIEQELRHRVRRDRAMTLDVLDAIVEANRRQIYALRGYSTSLKWLVDAYGLSQSAAHRRITTARFLDEFPETREALLLGFLNLSCVEIMQTYFNKQERMSGDAVTLDEKSEVTGLIYGKTVDEARVVLAEKFPDVEPSSESLRPVSGKQSKLTVILDESEMKHLKRAKELLSNSCRNWSETVGALAEDYVCRKDPLRKKPKVHVMVKDDTTPKMTHPFTASGKSILRNAYRFIPAATRLFVLQRDSSKCVYTDETTGHRCDSPERVQVDHIITLYEGGSNDPLNLRCLCRTHNLFVAKQRLGALMDKYCKTFV